jgi:hypothetical protein
MIFIVQYVFSYDNFNNKKEVSYYTGQKIGKMAIGHIGGNINNIQELKSYINSKCRSIDDKLSKRDNKILTDICIKEAMKHDWSYYLKEYAK